MADENIPKELFEHGSRGDGLREYHFIGCDGKPAITYLKEGDSLTKQRCPRDGVYVILYSAYLHNVLECPCCGEKGRELITDQYKTQRLITRLEQSIPEIEAELTRQKALMDLVKNPNHPIRAANLRNAKEMPAS